MGLSVTVRGARMNAAKEQQAALFKDYIAFQQVFPEVQQALKVATAKLVKQRPSDPISFLATQLREANADIKLEKHMAEQTRREQEQAAIRIQTLGRRKKDKARVDQIKVNNGIFVRELFKKLKNTTEDTVSGTGVLLFARGGEDRASLDLPPRLGRHIPPKINATCKKIVVVVENWPTTDKDMEWTEFAALFGLSENEANQAEQAAAAVR